MISQTKNNTSIYMDEILFMLLSYLFGKTQKLKKESVKYLSQYSTLQIKSFVTEHLNSKITVEVKLLCLCASHINEIERLKKLKNMLKSWSEQKYETKLILSLSYEKEYEIEVLKNVKYLSEMYDGKIIIEINELPKSQFEHYKNICEQYCEKYKDYWIYFTDDDDILSKNRSLIYALMIQNVINFKEETSYVEYPFIAEGNEYLSSVEEVLMKLMLNKINLNYRICMLWYKI